MAVTKKNFTVLAALTQAAIALPSVSRAGVSADYLYSDYQEADIPASKSADGRDAERYEVQSHLFRVVAPVGTQTIGANLSYETMSGASPWFVTPGPDGRPMQVMSGASIHEERVAVRGAWVVPVNGNKFSTTLGYSDEDDYRALSGGVEVEVMTDISELSWTAGLGYSADKLNPTVGASSPDVIDSAQRDTLTAYAGASLILDQRTVVQGSLSYKHDDGHLSDPYKLAYIESQASTIADRRPGGRNSWAAGAKLRHKVEDSGGALHLDYRYFHDDWKIRAHTLEIAWHQVLAGTWRVAPAIRWHSQSQAYFYAPYYSAIRDDGLASSDYRLSPFGAVSARIDVVKTFFGHWALGAGVEVYQADDKFALKQVDVENPGLVEYLSFSVRASYAF